MVTKLRDTTQNLTEKRKGEITNQMGKEKRKRKEEKEKEKKRGEKDD